MPTLADVLKDQLGISTFERVNGSASSLGTTAARVVPSNPNRLQFTISNMSANNMWVGPFADVSSTKGFFLAANGGFLEVIYDEDFSMVGREWFGVAAAAASSVLIVEQLISPAVEGS